MNPAPTFYWHDYETFGINTRRDRPAQFAGIRTDAELNETGSPLMVYCQPPADTLPEPESCLITGITPQHCAAEGLPEPRFAARIQAELAQPGTIGVGYNSMRFDAEVTRNLLWRNLRDPYGHEWRNGCSRWDLLDLVRAAHALRPEGIEWPQGDDGLPSLKLERLSAANGLAHEAAHDALSDVRATIALARLLRTRQPRLFDFCLALRHKQRVREELGLPGSLRLRQARPFLHISSMFGMARGCIAVMALLAQRPGNPNEFIAWDLMADPSELASLTPDAVRLRLFTPSAELPEGVTRLPIKNVHINRAPVVVANLKTLRPEQAERWGIDLDRAAQNLRRLQALPELSALWMQVYADTPHAEVPVEEALYDGFVGNADRQRLDDLLTLTPEALARVQPGFDDPRLAPLLLHYRARNYPHTLSADERAHWQRHCAARLRTGAEGALTLDAYRARLTALTTDASADARTQNLLAALEQWGDHLEQTLAPEV